MKKRTFVVDKNDRVLWAMCIAAYVLIADYYSPFCIVRAELDEGCMVEERPFAESLAEDRFIAVMATLAMFTALNPDSYTPTCLDQIPEVVMDQIAEMLRDRQEKADRKAVLKERDRLMKTASEILQKHHMYHLGLAAVLMERPLDTCVIENLKTMYCNNYDDVA